VYGCGIFCRARTINRAHCSPSPWNTRGTSGTNCTHHDKFVPCSGRSPLPPLLLLLLLLLHLLPAYSTQFVSYSRIYPSLVRAPKSVLILTRRLYSDDPCISNLRAPSRNIVPLYYILDFRIGTAESGRSLSITGEEYRWIGALVCVNKFLPCFRASHRSLSFARTNHTNIRTASVTISRYVSSEDENRHVLTIWHDRINTNWFLHVNSDVTQA